MKKSIFVRDQAPAIGLALGAGVVIVLADLVIGANFSSLFVVMPLIAATAAGPRRTAVMGALALALAITMSIVDRATLQGTAFRILIMVIAVVVAVALARERFAREERLSDLDRFADIAQELILREIPARLANVEAAGRYLSASTVVRVGGDLYDVALTPAGVHFVIGDACGKGIAGVRLAAQVLASFREGVFMDNLKSLAKRLDARVAAMAEDGDFVTATIGQIDNNGRLRVANCGHPDGALIREGKVEYIAPTERTPPLAFGVEPEVVEIQLHPGDRLVWWTDGVSEARNRDKEFFPVEEALAETADPTLAECLDRILYTVIEHSHGELVDDAALLGFDIKTGEEDGS